MLLLMCAWVHVPAQNAFFIRVARAVRRPAIVGAWAWRFVFDVRILPVAPVILYPKLFAVSVRIWFAELVRVVWVCEW